MSHGGRLARQGCTCDVCAQSTARRREYIRDYYDRFDRAARGVSALQSAEPVAAHIAACLDAGMSARQIALAAGVSEEAVRILADPPAGRRVRAATAGKILAVAPRRPLTPVGITRRLQSLGRLGWSSSAVARVAGINVDTVKQWRRGPRAEIHTVGTAIARAYDELSMRLPATNTRHERIAVARTRGHAERNGWPPPLAWDDATIDDPAATSDYGDRRTGLDLDEWLRLVRCGETPGRAARRCGVTLDAVSLAARRHGRRDVTTALTQAMAS